MREGKFGEIKRALRKNESAILRHSDYEGDWFIYDSSLENFTRDFRYVLPEDFYKKLLQENEEIRIREIFRRYIEETLSKSGEQQSDLFAVEFGGPGSEFFQGFSKNFFKKTAGVCLKDIRSKDIKFNDARNNHSVITGNILDLQSDQLFNKITQTLGIEKVDLIISRMDGPLSFFDKNGAILDRIIRNWYNFLNKNGLMFIQFERTLESDTRFLVEKWSGVIKKRFPKVDIQTGNYVLRLHKGTDAPEELPPATQLFRE